MDRRRRRRLTDFLPYYPLRQDSSFINNAASASPRNPPSPPWRQRRYPAFRLIFNQPINHFLRSEVSVQQLWGQILKTVIDLCRLFSRQQSLRTAPPNERFHEHANGRRRKARSGWCHLCRPAGPSWRLSVAEKIVSVICACVNKFRFILLLIDQRSLSEA